MLKMPLKCGGTSTMIRVPVEVARAHASRERRKAVEPDRAGQPSLRDTILLAYS